MRAYYGLRHGGHVDVFRWDSLDPAQLRRLPMRQDLRNHSPDGPEWGYGGSGPAQLALALLADALGDDALALQLYRRYKFHVVSHLDRHYWQISQEDVIAWVRDYTSSDNLPLEEPITGRVIMPITPSMEDESA